MNSALQIINGNHHTDERGTLTYFNSLDLEKVKRYYLISHPSCKVIRAWQGHKDECKWFHVIKGGFKIVTVKPDDWINPSLDIVTHEFSLIAEADKILYLPGGYASGLQATIPDSKMIIFSNMSVEDSKNDDFRFDKNLWYKW